MSWAIARNWIKCTLMVAPVKIAAPFVVPFLSQGERIDHDIFGAMDALDLSWWNIGVRNGGHNFLNKPTPEYDQFPKDLEDETLERDSGFQWRVRISKRNPAYASFRCTWGDPRPTKGKRELYVGWTMDKSRDEMGFSIAQFRPGWQGWVFAAWVICTLAVLYN